MKKFLLPFIILASLLSGRVYGQAVLQIDTTASMSIKFDTLGPKHKIAVSYNLINVATKAGDSLTRYMKIYTHLKINKQKPISTSKGVYIFDNLKPYFLSKKYFVTIHDTVVINDSILPLAAGTNVIVIWPTGNGVKTASVLNSQHSFSVLYTAIQPLEEQGIQIKLYPNPTTDIIHFDNPNPEVSLERIIITDMTGKSLYNRIHKDESLDVASLPPGSYILSLYLSNGKVNTYKIVRTEK